MLFMKKIVFTVILIYFSTILKAQTVREILTGKISFVSSQNIYVKFNSTEGISAGDTLYKSSSGVLKPVLSVTNLSSTSCVCTSISVSDVISAIKNNSSVKSRQRLRKSKSLIPLRLLYRLLKLNQKNIKMTQTKNQWKYLGIFLYFH